MLHSALDEAAVEDVVKSIAQVGLASEKHRSSNVRSDFMEFSQVKLEKDHLMLQNQAARLKSEPNAAVDITIAVSNSPARAAPASPSFRQSPPRVVKSASIFEAIDAAVDEAAFEQSKLRRSSPQFKSSRSPKIPVCSPPR